jgi:hypothetical protein
MKHSTIALFATLIVAAPFSLSSLAAESNDVKLKQEDGRVVVTMGGKPFTVYHFNDAEGRPFVRPYFHPVRAADGTEVTSDQVLSGGDHPHHRSLWVAHGDVNRADHWSFAQRPSPKQRHVRFARLGGDSFVQELEWEAKAAADGTLGILMRETRTARFFTFEDGNRGIDLTLVFTPATDERVVFADTKEAGLCAVRVNKSISDKPKLTNASGKSGEKQVWGKPAEWCDLSGVIDGKPYGVAVLDHPTNPRHPSTWHSRDYGLLAANIFGLHDFDKTVKKGTGDFTLEPGKTATFRYRIVIHQGDAPSAKLDEKFRDFAGEVGQSD